MNNARQESTVFSLVYGATTCLVIAAILLALAIGLVMDEWAGCVAGAVFAVAFAVAFLALATRFANMGAKSTKGTKGRSNG